MPPEEYPGRLLRSALRLDHPMADGEAHEARQVADLELRHDAAAVGVDAARLHAHDGGDFLARLSVDDELQYLAFARTEHIECSRFRCFFQAVSITKYVQPK